MEIKAELLTDKKKWEECVLEWSPQSFLQSWNWGETHRLQGSKVFRYAFVRNDKVEGVCQYILQKAKRGTHMLVPGGPLIDWKDKSLVNYFLDFTKTLAKENKCWFVRIRPEVLDSNESRKMFFQLGMKASNMHLHAENTWILDIDKDPEALLADMRKTTRYLVKKSLTKDISIEVSNSLSDLKYLIELQKETVQRHKFVGFSKNLFENQLKTFGADGQAKLFTIFYNGAALASAIIIFYGDTAYYHHSGSSEKAREIPVSYRLQWEVINYAKKRGLKKYNFWGIAPEGNLRHRFYGVTVFKTGFGGFRADWLHAHDIIISPLYWVTYIFEYCRKMLRHL